jgi:hypothetical protein
VQINAPAWAFARRIIPLQAAGAHSLESIEAKAAGVADVSDAAAEQGQRSTASDTRLYVV